MSFIYALADVIHIVIAAYTWIIVASTLISWVNPDPYNKIVQLLYRATEPVFALVRRYIPTVFGGIDIAPIIVLLSLMLIDKTMMNLVHGYVFR